MSLSAKDVKAALFTLCQQTLFTTATVVYGDPGSYTPDTIVSIGDQRLVFETGPMSPARPREEVVETDVIFTRFIGGDERAQVLATEAVYDMANQLAEHFRTKPNETLGGVCRDIHFTEGALVEGKASPTARGGGVAGRIAALSITLTSRARRP